MPHSDAVKLFPVSSVFSVVGVPPGPLWRLVVPDRAVRGAFVVEWWRADVPPGIVRRALRRAEQPVMDLRASVQVGPAPPSSGGWRRSFPSGAGS